MNLFDTIQDSFFVFLSLATIMGSLGVVLLPNLIYAAFLLGGVLICIAAIFLLLNADFIAAAEGNKICGSTEINCLTRWNFLS